MTTRFALGIGALALCAAAFLPARPLAAQEVWCQEDSDGNGVVFSDETTEPQDQPVLNQAPLPGGPVGFALQQQNFSNGLQQAAFCDSGCCDSGCCGGSDCCGGCCDGGCCGMGCCDSGCCGMNDCCGDSCCMSCCPPRKTCYAYGEFLYLRATGSDVAHAQQQDGVGGAGTTPAGIVDTIDYDYQSAYRVGFGCALDGCSSIGVSYTMFDVDTFSSLEPPVIGGGAGAVGSLVHHPQASITGSAGPVTATAGINYEIADLMFRDVFAKTCVGQFGYGLGAVYASFDQNFYQQGLFGVALDDIATRSDVTFSGGGLKAGINGERCLGSGLSVYGTLSAGALSGKFNTRYDMRNQVGDVRLAQAVWEDNRVVGLIEYEIGISATTPKNGVRVSLGYMVQHWTNMVTHPDFIDAVQADNYTDLGDTITFDGFSARLEGRF
ncbi:MAG: hypothetical protein KDA37_07675 [Planctomycetales bacterium]|nr:hypothetical protein [Planctomycetales bacterium]